MFFKTKKKESMFINYIKENRFLFLKIKNMMFLDNTSSYFTCFVIVLKHNYTNIKNNLK